MNVPDEGWTSVAGHWDRLRGHVEDMKAELTEQLLAGLEPLTGKRVLELGAGTGELAAVLADQAGPSGSVVASDFADGMVGLLAARLRDRPGVRVAKIDALDIPLEPASIDVVVFRMGLMLITEPDAALAEIRRVLRPGGQAGVAVWGGLQDNPWMTTVGMAAMMHGLTVGGPPVGPGAPFSLSDADDLEKRFRNVGFAQVQVRAVESSIFFPSEQEHFEVVSSLGPPVAAALAAASSEQHAAVRRTAAELAAQYRDGDGVRLPVRALLCLAEA